MLMKDPWTVILDATEFAIQSTTNRKKGYIPGQLIFGHEIILLKKYDGLGINTSEKADAN